jgi:hypothetical protein
MTFHGSGAGTFDPNINFGTALFQDHTPGMFVAYTANGWRGRIMATGGPTEASIAERSLPAAFSDPQAAFDDYGNLYLTYVTNNTVQFGTATAGSLTTLTDTARQWVPNMWAGMQLTINPGAQNQSSAIIAGNTATELTVGQAFSNAAGAGTVYAISPLAFTPNGAIERAGALAVLLSTNDGQSFQFLKFLDSGVAPNGAPDYPALATGPGQNANQKSVWVAWRGSNGQILAAGAPVAKGAVGSFIGAEAVTTATGMAFPRAAVGPNGQVMVSYVTQGAAPTSILVNVDADGLGPNGFGANPTTVTTTTIGVNNAPPFFTIPAQPNRGITPQVSLAWDRSGTYVAAPNGRVYLVYTYLFNTADTDIYVRYSDNSGATWSKFNQVSGTNTNSQFLPAIAVDQTDGDVAVTWLDARNDTNNVRVQLYGTASGDGGQTYLAPVRIARGQSDATRTSRLQTGTTTGNNTRTMLNDTTQDWTPNNYWINNFIANVAGTNTAPGIVASTATQLSINPNNPWAQAPAAGTAYEIQAVGPSGPEPVYNFDYGEYTGLAFYGGAFHPIWADNSNSTTDNPNGSNSALDVYTDSVLVAHAVGQSPSVAVSGDGNSAAPLEALASSSASGARSSDRLGTGASTVAAAGAGDSIVRAGLGAGVLPGLPIPDGRGAMALGAPTVPATQPTIRQAESGPEALQAGAPRELLLQLVSLPDESRGAVFRSALVVDGLGDPALARTLFGEADQLWTLA